MNGVFLFGFFILFLVIHICLQSTYHQSDSYRSIILLSIPEILIGIICVWIQDYSYFLHFLFSYQIFFIFIASVFTILEYRTSKSTTVYFLFLILYLFVIFASSFQEPKGYIMLPFSFASVLSCLSFGFYFLVSFKNKGKEIFSWKRIFLGLGLFVMTFFLYFLGRMFEISPVFIGMFCALPHVITFSKLLEEQATFSYFLKEEVYHFLLLSVFDFITPLSISFFADSYLVKCCHFGMFSHILFFFQNKKKSLFFNMIFGIAFILGYLYFFVIT